MKSIVKEAMEEGAMGIGSSLIYAPGDYADTEELILPQPLLEKSSE